MRLAGSAGLQGLVVLQIQAIALVSLRPEQYGNFALISVLYGLALSSSFSVIVDVWLRDSLQRESSGSGESPLIWYSILAGGVASAAAAIILDDALKGLLVWVAVSAATFRNGARMFRLAHRDWWRVIAGDVANLSLTLLVALLAAGHVEQLTMVLAAWAAGSVCAATVSVTAIPLRPRSLYRWVKEHWSAVAMLWRESLVLDLGVVGAPLTLAVLLARPDFAVYRALSSAVYPVRLILSPLRGVIAQGPNPARFPAALKYLSCAIALGATTTTALVFVGMLGRLDETVLPALADRALAVGLLCILHFMGFLFYVHARVNAGARRLRMARLLDTSAQLGIPIVGSLVWGLDGAIAGTVIAAVVTCLVWMQPRVASPVEL